MYLAKESLDDLKTMLTKAKIVNRLEELMPPGKRSAKDFAAHFGAAGLESLVNWNTQREMDSKIGELQVGGSARVCTLRRRCGQLVARVRVNTQRELDAEIVRAFEHPGNQACSGRRRPEAAARSRPATAAASQLSLPPLPIAHPACHPSPQDELTRMFADDPPHPVADVISMVKARKAEQVREWWGGALGVWRRRAEAAAGATSCWLGPARRSRCVDGGRAGGWQRQVQHPTAHDERDGAGAAPRGRTRGGAAKVVMV